MIRLTRLNDLRWKALWHMMRATAGTTAHRVRAMRQARLNQAYWAERSTVEAGRERRLAAYYRRSAKAVAR